MTDALDKLIAAVEAGKLPLSLDILLPIMDHYTNVSAAFYGSLDAAKTLHESLLPGWQAHLVIGGQGAGVNKWHCELEDWDSGERIDGNNQSNPARAWLLAILRAYREQIRGAE